jgi:signal transduction histidine kinase
MNTLKKRAAELNGDFKIISNINEGTAVQLKFKIT